MYLNIYLYICIYDVSYSCWRRGAHLTYKQLITFKIYPKTAKLNKNSPIFKTRHKM